MEFEMLRVDELIKPETKEFNLNPEAWNMKCCLQFTQGMDMAKKLADEVDGICMATIPMLEHKYVIGGFCNQGQTAKIMLFNAIETTPEEGKVHVFIPNPDSTKEFLMDKWIKYQKGEIFDI